MPSRKVAQGALLTVVAIVVGAGTVANMVMPLPAQERVVAASPPSESAKPILTARPADTAKRPVDGGAADAGSGQAKVTSLPAAAPAREKPATTRLTVDETPAKKAEAPVLPPPAGAPAADSAFPPVQPFGETPAGAAATPTPTPQRPGARATAGGPAVDKPATPKRAADNRQRKPAVRPEPYAMRDFLRSHW